MRRYNNILFKRDEPASSPKPDENTQALSIQQKSYQPQGDEELVEETSKQSDFVPSRPDPQRTMAACDLLDGLAIHASIVSRSSGATLLGEATSILDDRVEAAVARAEEQAVIELQRETRRRRLRGLVNQVQVEGLRAAVETLLRQRDFLQAQITDKKSALDKLDLAVQEDTTSSQEQLRITQVKRETTHFQLKKFNQTLLGLQHALEVPAELILSTKNSGGGPEAEEVIVSMFLLQKDLAEISEACSLANGDKIRGLANYHLAELNGFADGAKLEVQMIRNQVMSQKKSLSAELVRMLVFPESLTERQIAAQQNVLKDLNKQYEEVSLVQLMKAEQHVHLEQRVHLIKASIEKLKDSMPAGSLVKLSPLYQEEYRKSQLQQLQEIETRRQQLQISFPKQRELEIQKCRLTWELHWREELKKYELTQEMAQESQAKLKSCMIALAQEKGAQAEKQLGIQKRKLENKVEAAKLVHRQHMVTDVRLDETIKEVNEMRADLHQRHSETHAKKARLVEIRSRMKTLWLSGHLSGERYASLLFNCCARQPYSPRTASHYKQILVQLRQMLPVKRAVEKLFDRRKHLCAQLLGLRTFAAQRTLPLSFPAALSALGFLNEELAFAALAAPYTGEEKQQELREMRGRLEQTYSDLTKELMKQDDTMLGLLRQLEIGIGASFRIRKVEVREVILAERARLNFEQKLRKGRSLLNLSEWFTTFSELIAARIPVAPPASLSTSPPAQLPPPTPPVSSSAPPPPPGSFGRRRR